MKVFVPEVFHNDSCDLLMVAQAYVLAWSPDGQRIASGGDDSIVSVWDASTGQTILQYHGQNDVIFKIA